MTKAEEILEKHLENNIDQKIYLKGSKLTYDLCIDAINEAINYAHCSKLLNDVFEKDETVIYKNEEYIISYVDDICNQANIYPVCGSMSYAGVPLADLKKLV